MTSLHADKCFWVDPASLPQSLHWLQRARRGRAGRGTRGMRSAAQGRRTGAGKAGAGRGRAGRGGARHNGARHKRAKEREGTETEHGMARHGVMARGHAYHSCHSYGRSACSCLAPFLWRRRSNPKIRPMWGRIHNPKKPPHSMLCRRRHTDRICPSSCQSTRRSLRRNGRPRERFQ